MPRLAFLRAALIVLVVALTLTLVFLFATRPRDTLLYLGAVGLFGIASAGPTAFIITLGVIGVAVAAASVRPKARSQLLLSDKREVR